jgi:hypothetical protein
MKSLFEQFDVVQKAYPGASLEPGPNGVFLLCIPQIVLPPGWSQPQTHVRFIVPSGYPYAKPDCFWADQTLRLPQGRLPKNAQVGGPVTPGQPSGQLLWFSWHVAPDAWNPSTSSLMTYVQVIRNRFGALE